MMPMVVPEQAPVPPPAYHRAQARLGAALHIDALTLVRTLHLLTLCRLAVRLAHRRCPPPLPAGPGGAPRTYGEGSLLLIALLRTLWRLSYQDMHDWLADWPALALVCGLPLGQDGRPRIPSPSQQCKRGQAAGAPVPEALFILMVLTALRRRLIGARDLIIDSAPILAWRRADPDAAFGHAPAQHPRPLLRGYRVHTLLCRGSGLPVFFLLSPANVHDAPFARPRHGMGGASLPAPPERHPPGRRLLELAPHCLDPCEPPRCRGHPLESQTPQEPLLLATDLDQRRTRQAQFHRALLWPRLPLLSLATPALVGVVGHRTAGRASPTPLPSLLAWLLTTPTVPS